MNFVAAAHYDADGVTSGTANKPTGTADNDIMFALVMRAATVDPSTVPTGWTLLAARTTLSSIRTWLYYRVAASEGASYTWEWAAGARTGITIASYRSGFDTADPIDIHSDTAYTTTDTTIRAASMIVSAANSPILFFGLVFSAAAQTATPPTAPTTMTEDVDFGDTASRHWREFARIAAWTGSGATGDMDATSTASTNLKHAFAVALNPSAGGGGGRYAHNQILIGVG